MANELLLIGEQQKGETHKAVLACNDYLRMGPGRSLAKQIEKYTESWPDSDQEPPTTRLNTLKNWSTKFNWVERSQQYDAMIEEQKNERRKEIMESGLALDFERVFELKKLSQRLLEYFENNDIWIDVPMKIGAGKNARIELVTTYNSQMIYDLRGLLDDLAKETGGRDKKADKEELVVADASPLSIPAELIAPSFLGPYRDILQRLHTEYVFYGGRGSTKSSFISLIFITLLVNNPEIHGLATRQVKDTLRDSVYSQLEWAINMLGLDDKFKCLKSPLEIEYKPTGQKIYFRGADDPNKIKSIRPPFGHIGLLWMEELDQYHGEEAVRKIEQSVIRGGETAFIFKSFNPPKPVNNWANKYIKVPKDNQYKHSSTYLDVPMEWLGTPWLQEAEHLKEVNPPAYEHEYMGVANGLGGLVFDNVKQEKITDKQIAEFDRILQGLDWGYFPDPAHWGKMYYDAARMKLYIFDELRTWRTGNKALHDRLVKEKGVKPNDQLIADNAEPKSIGDFIAYGMRGIRAASKGPESVDYSMKWLQSLVEIVIDPTRAPYTAQEFTEYEYMRNKDEEIIQAYPDENNHAIDMTRYATNDIWRRRGQ